MSVIAVKITGKKIVIGADRQITFGTTKEIGSTAAKLVFYTNDLVVGSAGDTRVMLLLSLYLETNKPKNDDQIEIIRFFNGFEKWLPSVTNDAVKSLETQEFIIVINKKAFCFMGYYLVEITDFWAIGSGAAKALMGFELGFDVEKTLEAVCKVDLYCHGPIKIIEIDK